MVCSLSNRRGVVEKTCVSGLIIRLLWPLKGPLLAQSGLQEAAMMSEITTNTQDEVFTCIFVAEPSSG